MKTRDEELAEILRQTLELGSQDVPAPIAQTLRQTRMAALQATPAWWRRPVVWFPGSLLAMGLAVVLGLNLRPVHTASSMPPLSPPSADLQMLDDMPMLQVIAEDPHAS